MQIELILFAIVTFCYGIFTTIAVIGIARLQQFSHYKTVNNLGPTRNFISIVVSCRNEEANIIEFIEQLNNQSFSKLHFELIIIDDFSEDHTYEMARKALISTEIKHQVLKTEKQNGKKSNLSKAIDLASGNIIITTDADVCFRFSNWLQTINDYFELHRPALLIMPVDFMNNGNLLAKFQIIENIALTATTAGYCGNNLAFLCNGANLAFTKKAYEEAGGYQSHLTISSGEDIFLMEDIKKKHPFGIHYGLNRELIVKTKAQNTLNGFFNQRVRWAYKAKFNKNPLNFLTAFIILGANLLFPALFISFLHQSILSPYLAIFVMIKLLFDFLLLFLASIFLGRAKFLFWLIPFELMYWFYALIIGISSIFWKPYWKGKKVN